MDGTKPKRILVIDSNPDIRQLIDVIVRKTGNDPFIVSTIEEAKRAVDVRKFDMIICDVGVSDGTCDEFVANAHKLNPELPIIVFTDIYRPSLSLPLRNDNCFRVERFNFKQLHEAVAELSADPESID